MHAHRCKSCGRVWFHSGEMRGVEAAHRCICGAVQWEQFKPAVQPLAVGNAAHGHNHDHAGHALMHKVLVGLEITFWVILTIGVGYQLWKVIREQGIEVSQ